MTHDRRIRFGGFDFDPDTGELTRSGAPVARLQEQPCRVLDALTANAGRLVTREELHKLLWPENSLVDADNGLNIAINKIRLALEDSAASPRFIQTVPRRGYKFIAQVVEQRCSPGALPDHVQVAAAAPADETPAIPVTRARYVRPVLAASLTLALATTGARWLGPRAPTVHTAAVMPFANLTGDPGLDYAGQGLTDTLATGLAMRGMPRVISPDATASYKASNLSLKQIAGELHADALVLGSIVRDGASFAVNVRLVDGRNAAVDVGKAVRPAGANGVDGLRRCPGGSGTGASTRLVGVVKDHSSSAGIRRSEERVSARTVLLESTDAGGSGIGGRAPDACP